MALRDIVNTVIKEAKDVASAAFDPIWEKHKEVEKEVETVPEVENSTPEDTTQKPVTDPKPVENQKPLRPASSMDEAWHFLRLEAVDTAEKKTLDAYKRLKEAHEKNETVTNLLQVVTSQSSSNGHFEAKDDETKRLLFRARMAGVNMVEGKHSFTKEERDSLVRNIELRNRNLELDLKLLTNEAQESIQYRNMVYQELKTSEDKMDSAKRKCFQGIR